ncbi:unnamed protein product [Prorocentrum cordatum]|uniref:Non-specific serine/threonine protein kinase n=1 Tax=Prorocentrum cordatum TaxID=2364126 RepID=A0ABN9RSU4_9DINO|nr:unnamed protein product [Polarella glacialis]
MGGCASTPPAHGGRDALRVAEADVEPRRVGVRSPGNPTLLGTRAPGSGGVARGQLILDKPGRIEDAYTLDKKLGEGAYGAVRMGKHKSTGCSRAIKTIAKDKMSNVARFKQEIAIMKVMDHPNIIKLYETFEDRRNIYLAMELCKGGELFYRIIDAGSFTEAQAAIVMQQMLRAVFYMHGHSICHRDLKPENFISGFLSKDPIEKNVLKLIDFGLSCQFKEGEWLRTKAGTPYYVAPQVLTGKYDQACDLWSAGVIMHILLCGYPPFQGADDRELLAKVKVGHVRFGKDWSGVSDDAKALVRKLICKDPKERYTAEQALGHQWIKHTAPKAENVPLDAGFVDKLRAFRCHNKFAKAALHVIAQQANEAQVKGLREAFLSLDGNSDGMLSLAEMKEGLGRAGVSVPPGDMQEIMDGIDADCSGVIRGSWPPCWSGSSTCRRTSAGLLSACLTSTGTGRCPSRSL